MNTNENTFVGRIATGSNQCAGVYIKDGGFSVKLWMGPSVGVTSSNTVEMDITAELARTLGRLLIRAGDKAESVAELMRTKQAHVQRVRDDYDTKIAAELAP